MRGGHYYYPNGNLYNQSSNGYYWSRRLNNATAGGDLYFNSGYVYPQVSSYRGLGFAIRCLRARTTPILAPLSLVRGGYYNYSNGNLDDQSINGRYWLQRLDNVTYGNYLYFHSGIIYPQYSVSRGRGFQLRCFVR